MDDFNPRTHEGCDLRQMSISLTTITNFNPRTHEGCDYEIERTPSYVWHFNPRTHEGCDVKLHRAIIVFQISIHAPTRGATSSVRTRLPAFPNFNPRTHEGCDKVGKAYIGKHHDFNPRTHEGCDCSYKTVTALFHEISIHAPTRGATEAHGFLVLVHRYFNPRTHEGCDDSHCEWQHHSMLFQSTHPRGVRRLSATMV